MEKSWAEGGVESAPDLAGGVGGQLQFGPLLFFGEEIAFGGGSEAALRADREIFERNETRGLLDTAREVVGRFQVRQF
jgi:hypothetical protein